MGKKSRQKRERRINEAPAVPLPEVAAPEPVPGIGAILPPDVVLDLRHVPEHVENFLKGLPEAEATLKMMGRDAVALVQEIADERAEQKLQELARRMVALRPSAPTNFTELRVQSIAERLERERGRAPQIGAAPLSLGLAQIAFFDPQRVIQELVKGGRPRTDFRRMGAGDIAWFIANGVTAEHPAALEFALTPPPAGQPTLGLRLKVDSGVVFVGPPEAADGPRFGGLRVHPLRTQLEECAGRGAFLRVEPGLYDLRVFRRGETRFALHVTPADPADPSGEAIAAGLGALDRIPAAVSGATS